MLKKLILILLFPVVAFGQDTFSIVAVDPETGEVGSAGATCLDDDVISGGAIIISDIVPGVGAVNTQSYYLPANQSLANGYLNDGYDAKQILDEIVINDVENDASVRQYGAATLKGDDITRSSAFTGDNCFDVKHHRIGLNFAVQGNILLNEGIVDSMYERFLNTNGPLHLKLMSALQGANVPGADSRCLNEGVSSQSAFIRVAKSTDTNGDFWMDLNVSKTPFGVEPIDQLQELFDEFVLINKDDNFSVPSLKVAPNPSNGLFNIAYDFEIGDQLLVYDLAGKEITKVNINEIANSIKIELLSSGSYTLIGIDNVGKKLFNRLVVVEHK